MKTDVPIDMLAGRPCADTPRPGLTTVRSALKGSMAEGSDAAVGS